MASDCGESKSYAGNVGGLIHDMREAQGLTLEELAQRVNMTAQRLSDIEHGRRPIGQSKLIVLASILGISQEYAHYCAGIVAPTYAQLCLDPEEHAELHRVLVEAVRVIRGEDEGKDGTP